MEQIKASIAALQESARILEAIAGHDLITLVEHTEFGSEMLSQSQAIKAKTIEFQAVVEASAAAKSLESAVPPELPSKGAAAAAPAPEPAAAPAPESAAAPAPEPAAAPAPEPAAAPAPEPAAAPAPEPAAAPAPEPAAAPAPEPAAAPAPEPAAAPAPEPAAAPAPEPAAAPAPEPAPAAGKKAGHGWDATSDEAYDRLGYGQYHAGKKKTKPGASSELIGVAMRIAHNVEGLGSAGDRDVAAKGGSEGRGAGGNGDDSSEGGWGEDSDDEGAARVGARGAAMPAFQRRRPKADTGGVPAEEHVPKFIREKKEKEAQAGAREGGKGGGDSTAAAAPAPAPAPTTGASPASSGGGPAASGISPTITLSSKASAAFQSVRQRKRSWALLKPDSKSMSVKQGKLGKLTEDATPEQFLKQLPFMQCRYAVYDWRRTMPDGRRNETMYLIAWAPPAANSADKTFMASQTTVVERMFEGVVTVQASSALDVRKALGIGAAPAAADSDSDSDFSD